MSVLQRLSDERVHIDTQRGLLMDTWQGLSSAFPIPGSVEGVRGIHDQYRRAADEVRQQAEELVQFSARVHWQSEAAVNFQQSAGTLGTSLDKVVWRYSSAAGVAGQWVGELQSFIARHDQIVGRARSLGPQPQPPYGNDVTDAERDEYRRLLHRWQASMSACRRDLQNLVHDYDRRAQDLAKQLRYVIDNDGLHDSFYEEFKQWVHDHADVLKELSRLLKEVAGWVGDIAAVIELIAVFMPPPVDAVMLAVGKGMDLAATVLSAAALVTDLVLWAGGEGSLTTVAVDLIQTGTSLVSSKLAGSLGKAAEAGFSRAASKTSTHAFKQAIHGDFLDKTGKFIAKNSPDIAKDLGASRKSFRLLEKAFHGELGPKATKAVFEYHAIHGLVKVDAFLVKKVAIEIVKPQQSHADGWSDRLHNDVTAFKLVNGFVK